MVILKRNFQPDFYKWSNSTSFALGNILKVFLHSLHKLERPTEEIRYLLIYTQFLTVLKGKYELQQNYYFETLFTNAVNAFTPFLEIKLPLKPYNC